MGVKDEDSKLIQLRIITGPAASVFAADPWFFFDRALKRIIARTGLGIPR